MQFEQIIYEQRGPTAIITLNRPEKRNALSGKMLGELAQALWDADERASVHSVILRAAGQHFCAGFDLGEYSTREGDDYRGRAEIDDDIWAMSRGQRLRMTLFDMHKPVVAAVQGTCIGVGTGLIGLCDMVLIAEDARLGFPPVRDLGSPPDSMWLYQCGPQWAKRLLLTGDSLTGTDAAQIGLALKAVPPEELDAEAIRLTDKMGLIDPHLLSANKRLVNLGLELMGARTMQRLTLEIDARGHTAPGARAMQQTMREVGYKEAYRQREQKFGVGYVNPTGKDPD